MVFVFGIAALDAYCLLEVYKTMAEQCSRMGISVGEIFAGYPGALHKPANTLDYAILPRSYTDEFPMLN